jgi:putative membrane protein
MISEIRLLGAIAALGLVSSAAQANSAGPSDPEIAHIAYTAGQLDIEAAKLALAKSQNADVRTFAEAMLRDHQAVNEKALALVGKLKVTPADNATSKALAAQAQATIDRLSKLQGAEFDRAYAQNEAAYHGAVNGALKDLLIPSADNGELKGLLETGLTLFKEHQLHAEHLAKALD